MKISKYLALGLLVISLAPVFGQSDGTIVLTTGVGQQNQPPALTKFNLDFPGGTPKELIAAIEKATGKPLNAIIPDEGADVQLPPLKMNGVVVPQLFTALQEASVKQIAVVTSTFGGFGGGGRSGPSSYSTFNSGYAFKTEGEISDNSIWYFHIEKPSLPPAVSTEKICRFYPLSSYLESGLTVDDITTAIQTGWKMSGDTSAPELNYHKETKLLIAFGEPDKLEVIDNVLRALQSQLPSPTFNDRLQDIIHKSQQSSVAPPTTPQRMAPMPKPPENPAAGQ